MNPPTQQRTASAQDDEVPTSEVFAQGAEYATHPHPVSATVVLLPLQPEHEPRFMWDTRLRAGEGAGHNARLQVRTRLTMANWTGDIDIAARIADKLTDNAAKHGRPFSDGRVILRLRLVPETDELLIEVDDSDPAFPDFEEATSESRGTESGLGFVKRHQARLSWDVKKDADGPVLGKTVQALVPVSWEKESA